MLLHGARQGNPRTDLDQTLTQYLHTYSQHVFIGGKTYYKHVHKLNYIQCERQPKFLTYKIFTFLIMGYTYTYILVFTFIYIHIPK